MGNGARTPEIPFPPNVDTFFFCRNTAIFRPLFNVDFLIEYAKAGFFLLKDRPVKSVRN